MPPGSLPEVRCIDARFRSGAMRGVGAFRAQRREPEIRARKGVE